MRRSYFKTFWIFLGGGFLIMTAMMSFWLISEVIRIDFLRDNPHRTREHALLLAVLSPLYGAFFVLFLKLLPLLAGAALAAVGRAIFRTLPFWYLILTLAVCLLVEDAQGLWRDTDSDEGPPVLSVRLLMSFLYQGPSLLICWWWDRRRNSDQAATALRVPSGAH
jgi:hypothetical protein